MPLSFFNRNEKNIFSMNLFVIGEKICGFAKIFVSTYCQELHCMKCGFEMTVEKREKSHEINERKRCLNNFVDQVYKFLSIQFLIIAICLFQACRFTYIFMHDI